MASLQFLLKAELNFLSLLFFFFGVGNLKKKKANDSLTENRA